MVIDVVKTVGSKVLIWMLILSALFSVSCVLDVKRTSRVLVQNLEIDSTVFAVWCHFVCLVLTALLFHWQLHKVDADKTSLLNSWVTTIAFMLVYIPLVTRLSLNLGIRYILQHHVNWIRPLTLKWVQIFSTFTLSLMYRQASVVTGSGYRALKVVVFLMTAWSAAVLLMTFCYLRLGLHRMFTHTETLVDVSETSYGHLLLASFFIFLVVDYNRNRPAALATPPQQTVGVTTPAQQTVGSQHPVPVPIRPFVVC